MVNLSMDPINVKCVKITILFCNPWNCMKFKFPEIKFSMTFLSGNIDLKFPA